MHDDYIYQDRDELEFLILLQLKIFGMNNENLMQTVNSIEILEEKQQLTLNIIVSQMIYSCFVIKPNRSHIILNFIKEILVFEVNNKNKINFFDVLIQFLLEKYTQESNYLICKLIENNFLEPKIIENRKNLYFIHYKSEEEINELLKTKRFMGQIKENIEKLSKNDWELHKQLIKEGVNPNEIAKIIRNDELEKLQEISSQTNFDFNQIIEPSLYERCSFINKKNVTLIDYAAFFSAVKCFKYLLMNNANVNNTGKYAAASGNNEIIHLCEQNHSSFEGSLEAAIIFHQNDIFKYIYENKTIKIKSLEELGKKCILYHNYELFSYLINKKMKINNYIINETARFGNLFLVKYFRKFNQLPKNILVFSAQSGNIELVKYVLRQKE